MGLDIALSKIPGGALARGAQKIITEGFENEINQLLKDAMLNPTKAQDLIS